MQSPGNRRNVARRLGLAVVICVSMSLTVTELQAQPDVPHVLSGETIPEPTLNGQPSAASTGMPWNHALNDTELLSNMPVPSSVRLPPRPMSLEQCIAIGLKKQPALHAAAASIAANQAGLQALKNTGHLQRWWRPDIVFREKQACLGMRAARANLATKEWETVYGITWSYFTVLLARRQLQVLDAILTDLRSVRDSAVQQVNLGNPDFTDTAVDTLNVNVGLYDAKRIFAVKAADRAMAALREAMGLPPDCPLCIVGDLPPVHGHLDRKTLRHLALTRRGEIIQATTVAEVVRLEICAQNALRARVTQTFAAGSDLHARSIPTGSYGVIYKPGASGVEMPSTLVGTSAERVRRVKALLARAEAVAQKARGLIALEIDNTFFRWQDAAHQATRLSLLLTKAQNVVDSNKAAYNLIGAGKVQDLLRSMGQVSQIQAEYNKALYDHVIALAGLERETAGGFRPPYRHVHCTTPAAPMLMHETPVLSGR